MRANNLNSAGYQINYCWLPNQNCAGCQLIYGCLPDGSSQDPPLQSGSPGARERTCSVLLINRTIACMLQFMKFVLVTCTNV